MVQLKGIHLHGIVWADTVSIPYGTIKRTGNQEQNFWVQMFQFLMVQLKALLRHDVTAVMMFQFLMVQLKAWPRDFHLRSVPFQFLMVQLKEVEQLNRYEIVSFQFLMVQLKVGQDDLFQLAY